MEQAWKLIVEYEYIWQAALIILQTIMLIATIHMIRKLTRKVTSIQTKVKEYLDTVWTDENEESEQPVAQQLVSLQEKQMAQSIREKQKAQEEAVFNAVLQEIFP